MAIFQLFGIDMLEVLCYFYMRLCGETLGERGKI